MIFLNDDEAEELKETYEEALKRCLEDEVNIFFLLYRTMKDIIQ